MSAQLALFEPAPSECGPLALDHIKKAEAAARAAEVACARGWATVESSYRRLAASHSTEAEDLAMLADFYRLGGVAS